MPLAAVQRGYLEGSDAVIDAFKDCLVAGGWTLYDDLSSGSDKAYVMKSLGESGTEFPVYLYIYKNANNINLFPSRGWNLTTHAARQSYGHASYSYIATPGASGFMYFYIACNKDSMLASVNYSGGAWDLTGMCLMDPFVSKPLGVLQSDVTAGADKVIQLAAGEADDFEVGFSYDIIDEISRNYVTVTAVDKVNHRVTATLAYAFTVANHAMIGLYPDSWICFATASSFLEMPRKTSAITNAQTLNTYETLIPYNHGDPCAITNKYILIPCSLGTVGSTALGGVFKATCVFLRCYINTTAEHTLSVGDLDSGQSSGSNSGTTLNDTTQAWTVNEFANKVIIVSGGTGVNQIRKIVSNTATEITVAAWTTTPDATSTYVICEEAWIYLYKNHAVRGLALRMM